MNKPLTYDCTDFFIRQIKKIRQELDNKQEYKPSSSNTPKLNYFKAVTEDEIKSIINKLANKSCKPDPVPTSLLKNHPPSSTSYNYSHNEDIS